jgi:drug/metabolite transporter (DMT)-like permease
LVRWAGDVPFSVIAFYRLAISTAVLYLYHRISLKQKPLKIQQGNWHYVLAGFFLAAHFITWIASLQMTSIANSIFLESTHPLFAILISAIFLKEYPPLRSIPSFIIAIFGMLLIVYPDIETSARQLFGDLLAILSAMFLALYLFIARFARSQVGLIKYLIYVYGSATIFCALYLLLQKEPVIGFSSLSWSMMILLALGPNLLGHSLLNWAARQIEIYKVNLVLLLEPILATVGGIFLFYEFPVINFYIGASLIIISVGYIIFRSNTR